MDAVGSACDKRSPSSKASALTFFGSLSTDVLSSIISHADIGRYSDGTRSNRRFPFLRLLFSEKSPFYAAASSMFTRVSINDVIGTSNINVSEATITIGAEYLVVSTPQCGMAHQIMNACGAALKTVEISDISRGADGELCVEKFITLVNQYCRNIDEVIISRIKLSSQKLHRLKMFMNGYEAQLRRIEWNCDYRDKIPGIPHLSTCTRIRRFVSHDVRSTEILSNLESFGESLEELVLKLVDMGGYPDVLEVIKESCRRLSVIMLYPLVDQFNEERYVSLLCSYGTQLIRANIETIECRNMEKVIDSCSNLRFQYNKQHFKQLIWNRISIAAPRIDRLAVSQVSCLENKCSSAMARCTYLRSLWVSSIGNPFPTETSVLDEMLMNLFGASTFHLLEELSIGMFNPTPQNIELIASKTSRLKRFSVQPCTLHESGNVFNAIIQSNPLLNRVFISKHHYGDELCSYDNALKILRQLLNTFSKCRDLYIQLQLRNLEPLDVNIDDLRTICSVVPCRGVEVTLVVDDVVYRQTGF